MSGTITLSESGGTTTEDVALDIRVGIPLVGGKIEQLVGDLLVAALKIENRVGRDYLSALTRSAGAGQGGSGRRVLASPTAPPAPPDRPAGRRSRWSGWSRSASTSRRRITTTTTPSTTNGPNASSSVSACSNGCSAPKCSEDARDQGHAHPMNG